MNKLILALLLLLPMAAHAQVSGPGNTFGFRSQVNVPLDLDGDGCKETIEIGDFDGDGVLEITDDIEAGMDALVGATGLGCSTGGSPFLTTAPKHVTLIPGIFRASETNGAWPTPGGFHIRYGLFLTIPSDTLFECPLATGSASGETSTDAGDGVSVRSLTVIRAPHWSDTTSGTGEVNGLGAPVTDDRRDYSVVGSRLYGAEASGAGSKNIIIRGCEFDGNMGTDYAVRTSSVPTRMVGRFHECTDCRVERNFFHGSTHSGLYGKYVNGFIADGNRISHYGNYNAAQTGAATSFPGQAGFYAYTTTDLGDMSLIVFRNNFVIHGSAGAVTRRDFDAGATGSDAPFARITEVFYDNNIFQDLKLSCLAIGGVSGGHARNTVCADFGGGRLFENHSSTATGTNSLNGYAVGSYEGDLQAVDNFTVSGMTMFPRAGAATGLSLGAGLDGVLLENIYMDARYQISAHCVSVTGPSNIKIRNMVLRRCGSELEQGAFGISTVIRPGYNTNGATSAIAILTGFDALNASACPGTDCGQGFLDIDGLVIDGYYTSGVYITAGISGQSWRNVSISGGKGTNNLGPLSGIGTVYGLRTLPQTNPIYDMTFKNWDLKAVPDRWAYRGEYSVAALPTCQQTEGGGGTPSFAQRADRFENTWVMIDDADSETDISVGGGGFRNRAYCVLNTLTSTWGWQLFRVKYGPGFAFQDDKTLLSGRLVFKDIELDWADGDDSQANYAIDFNAASVQSSTFAGTILDGVTIRGHEIGPYENALSRGIRTGSGTATDWKLSGSTGAAGVSVGSEEPICDGLFFATAGSCIGFAP